MKAAPNRLFMRPPLQPSVGSCHPSNPKHAHRHTRSLEAVQPAPVAPDSLDGAHQSKAEMHFSLVAPCMAVEVASAYQQSTWLNSPKRASGAGALCASPAYPGLGSPVFDTCSLSSLEDAVAGFSLGLDQLADYVSSAVSNSGLEGLKASFSAQLNSAALQAANAAHPDAASRPVFMMLPLDTVNSDGVFRYASAQWFSHALQLLAATGAHGIAVDVWWGAVERSPREYNWNGYKQLFEMVRATGLKVQVVMSFHACGGNVGDTAQVPLPSWVLAAGQHDPDIFFTDRPRDNGLGQRNKEYISIFADEAPVLFGRSPMDCYREFMASFKEAFAGDLAGGLIDEVVVGMGPCGELRYPSYVEANGWRFPGVGEFQCYDRRALASLAQAAREAGHPEWGYAGPHDSGHYSSIAEETGFFRSEGSWDSDYGAFFLNWYSGQLLAHGERLLSAASCIFGAYQTSSSASSAGPAGILVRHAAALLQRLQSLIQFQPSQPSTSTQSNMAAPSMQAAARRAAVPAGASAPMSAAAAATNTDAGCSEAVCIGSSGPSTPILADLAADMSSSAGSSIAAGGDDLATGGNRPGNHSRSHSSGHVGVGSDRQGALLVSPGASNSSRQGMAAGAPASPHVTASDSCTNLLAAFFGQAGQGGAAAAVETWGGSSSSAGGALAASLEGVGDGGCSIRSQGLVAVAQQGLQLLEQEQQQRRAAAAAALAGHAFSATALTALVEACERPAAALRLPGGAVQLPGGSLQPNASVSSLSSGFFSSHSAWEDGEGPWEETGGRASPAAMLAAAAAAFNGNAGAAGGVAASGIRTAVSEPLTPSDRDVDGWPSSPRRRGLLAALLGGLGQYALGSGAAPEPSQPGGASTGNGSGNGNEGAEGGAVAKRAGSSKGERRVRSPLALTVKIAGVHWWYKSHSHAGELTAGYYNTSLRDGYRAIVELCARHNAGLTLTCVEMCDAQHPPRARCGPEGLLRQVRTTSAHLGVPLSGENALPIFLQGGVDTVAFDRIVANTCAWEGSSRGAASAPCLTGFGSGNSSANSTSNSSSNSTHGGSSSSMQAGSSGGGYAAAQGKGHDGTYSGYVFGGRGAYFGSSSAHHQQQQGQQQQQQQQGPGTAGRPPRGYFGRVPSPKPYGTHEPHTQQHTHQQQAQQQQQQQQQYHRSASGLPGGSSGAKPPASTIGTLHHSHPEPLPAMRAFTFLRLGPELLQPAYQSPWMSFMHRMQHGCLY